MPRAHPVGLHMNRRAWGFVITILIVGYSPVASLLSVFSNPAVYAETINRIVAVVNDEVITQTDVSQQVRMLRQDFPELAGEKVESTELDRLALQRLIEYRLIRQQAKRSGVTISTDEVAQRLAVLRGRFDSQEDFQRWLAQSDRSLEELKEYIRDQLMIQRLIETKVRAGIVVSPQEVTQAAETHPHWVEDADRVHASHILVRVRQGRSLEQARTLMAEIQRQLSQGAEFAALAKKYSDDAGAQSGGDMGWVKRAELLPELDAVLFSVNEGSCSGPIETMLGVHLLCVHERSLGGSLSVKERYQKLSQKLFEQKMQEALERWVKELKQQAYIEFFTEES